MNNQNEFDLTDKQRTIIVIPLLLGAFLTLLNETLLNVAFPQLISTLNVSIVTVQWLATAYMLIIGILVPVTAFLMETFTTKKLFMIAILLFIAGTLMCGVAQSFVFLLVSRLIQAVGTGMILPLMMNTVMAIYPPAKRGTALGTCMLAVLIAPAIAPTVTGLILQAADWHALFFMMLPLAVIAMVLGAIHIKNISRLTKPKIDVLSVILSTIGFGGLIFAICSIENLGFMNPTVLISLICGVGGLILFSKRQFTLKQPMLELRIFRFPIFSLGSIIILITFLMPFAVNIVLPTYMQTSLGLTPFVTGLALLPGGIVGGFTTSLSGRLFDKIGAKPLTVCGFAISAAAMFFLSHISSATTLVTIIVFHICMYFGLSLVITPLQTNSLNQLPRKDHAHGVAIINTVQQIGAAFGSSLFIGLMGAEQTKYLSKLNNPGITQQQNAVASGVHAAFTAAFILIVVALILCLFIKRENKGSKRDTYYEVQD